MVLSNGKLFQRASLLTLSFILAISSMSAAVPLFLSQSVFADSAANVVTNNTSHVTYTTIQAAVSVAMTGDTIEVGSGTYNLTSELVITRPLSIVGPSIGIATIKADNPAWSITGPSANSTKHLIGIFAGTPSNPVSISNITFDSNYQSYGVNTYANAYGVLNNVTIKNSKGAGLTVNGSTIVATNLNTSGNYWGAVNVDPGSGVTTPSAFNLSSGNLGDGNQIWSDGKYVTSTATVAVNTPANYVLYHLAANSKFQGWTNGTITPPMNTAPTLTVAIPVTSSTVSTVKNGNNLKITGNFSDNIKANYAQFQLVKDGNSKALGIVYGSDSAATYADASGNYMYSMPVPADLASGEYSLFYTGTNFTGGATPRMERKFTIDNKAPETTIAVSPLTSGVASKTFKVSGHATDDIALNRVYVQLINKSTGARYGGTTVNLIGTSSDKDWYVNYDASLLNMPSGEYYAVASPVDMVGNTTTAPFLQFTLDSTDPTAPTLITASPYIANGATKTLAWSSPSTDTDIDHYEYAEYNNTAPTSDTTLLSWTKIVDGTSTTDTAWQSDINIYWRVRAVDHAGNVSPWSAIGKIVTDRTPPKVGLTTPTGTTNANTAEVKGYATDSNMLYYACYISTNQTITAFNKSWAPGQEPKSGVNNDQSLADSSCITHWTTTATGSQTNPVTLGSFNISNLPDGSYTIHVHAHDQAGNVTEKATTFTIDKKAPAAGALTMKTTLYPDGFTVASPTNGVYTITTPLSFNGVDVFQGLSVVVNDENLNTANVPVSINGTLNGEMVYDSTNHIWNYDGQTSTPTFIDGAQTITATFKDIAGNETPLTLHFTTNSTPTPQLVANNYIGSAPITHMILGTTNTSVTPTGTAAKTQLATDNQGTPEILGAQTKANTTDTMATPEVKGDSTQADQNSGRALAWYWWVLVVAVATSFIWWLIARRRNLSEV